MAAASFSEKGWIGFLRIRPGGRVLEPSTLLAAAFRRVSTRLRGSFPTSTDTLTPAADRVFYLARKAVILSCLVIPFPFLLR